MKNKIEKTFLIGTAQAIVMLASHTVDATVHVMPSKFCDNATNVSYHDALCQADIHSELFQCRDTAYVSTMIACVACLVTWFVGMHCLTKKMGQAFFDQELVGSASRVRFSLWNGDSQAQPLNPTPGNIDGYGAGDEHTINISPQ